MDKIIKELGLNNEYTLTKSHFRPKNYNKVWLEIYPHEDYNLMCDMMDLPTTKSGYKHLFCIVDLFTLDFDCEPVKNKTAESALNAMKECFKRGYVNKPYASVATDGGSEFKSVFHKWLYDANIYHKVGIPYRHRQQSVIESLNRSIGKLLMLYLSQMGSKTETTYSNWDEFIPQVRKALNEYRQELFKKLLTKYKNYDTSNVDSKPKFQVGEVVHYRLDYPENQFGDRQSSSKFREGDNRYSSEVRKIIHIVVMNSKPWYRYMLEGKPNVSYSEFELLPSNKKESTYKVKQIIDRKTENKQKYYLVWWKGELKKNSTWESETALIEDGLQDYIQEFEDNLKELISKKRQKVKEKQAKANEQELIYQRQIQEQKQKEKDKPKINVSEQTSGRVLRSGKAY